MYALSVDDGVDLYRSESANGNEVLDRWNPIRCDIGHSNLLSVSKRERIL